MGAQLVKQESRLVIVGFSSPLSKPDIDGLMDIVRTSIGKAGGQAVFLGDFGLLGDVLPHVVDGLLAIMRKDNSALIRSALVAPSQGYLKSKLASLVDEAGENKRRVFIDVMSARGWLQEVLQPEETRALDSYLNSRGVQHLAG